MVHRIFRRIRSSEPCHYPQLSRPQSAAWQRVEALVCATALHAMRCPEREALRPLVDLVARFANRSRDRRLDQR